MLKKFLLAIALALPMLASAQTVKIGLIDTSAILGAMPDTKAAQTEFEEKSKRYETEYRSLVEEMNRRMEEYRNMKEDELPAIRERKTREINEFQQKIQDFQNTADRDLQKLQQDLMAPVMQKVRQAIESVGKEGSYTLLLELSSALYYGAPAEDITNAVKAKLGL